MCVDVAAQFESYENSNEGKVKTMMIRETIFGPTRGESCLWKKTIEGTWIGEFFLIELNVERVISGFRPPNTVEDSFRRYYNKLVDAWLIPLNV